VSLRQRSASEAIPSPERLGRRCDRYPTTGRSCQKCQAVKITKPIPARATASRRDERRTPCAADRPRAGSTPIEVSHGLMAFPSNVAGLNRPDRCLRPVAPRRRGPVQPSARRTEAAARRARPGRTGVGHHGWYCDGDTLFAVSAQHGHEGVVAKRLDSPYLPGRRSRSSFKSKCPERS
jgi:hypothetical protein